MSVRPSGQINAATATVRQRKPEPVYVVRCTARGCDWSIQTNVAKDLGRYWRWHAAWHRGQR